MKMTSYTAILHPLQYESINQDGGTFLEFQSSTAKELTKNKNVFAVVFKTV